MDSRRQYYASMAIMGTLFFFFGMISWVNSVLIPYFKVTCELSLAQAYLVGFVFYIAYLVMAIPSSMMLDAVGYKRGISYGLFVMALGALCFVPAALTRCYALFLAGLFLLGIGLAVLQTAGNPFVTVIGPMESAAKRMSVMGVCNKLAGIIAPLVLGYVIIRPGDAALFEQAESGMDTIGGLPREMVLDEMVRRVIVPYLILAVVLIGFGLYVRRSPLPDIAGGAKAVETEDGARRSIFCYPYLVLGVVAMVCHLGTQALCINTLVTSSVSLGTDIAQAKLLPPMILFSTFIGFALGTVLIPRVVSQLTALRIASLLNLIASVAVLCVSGRISLFGVEVHSAMWILILMGIPNAFLYSGIWPLAIRKLGRHTSLGSAWLVMALASSGVFPLFYAGEATRLNDAQSAYWLMIPCFVFLLYYALRGYKLECWNRHSAEKR